MYLVARSVDRQIRTEAEAAYPEECCGLLIGRRDPERGRVLIERAAPSANLAVQADRFEIDPGLRLRLQRELRGTGSSVLGHYHSHPDSTNQPSETDLEAALEPELVWYIVAVENGGAGEAGLFALDKGVDGFTPVPFEVSNEG